MQSKSPEVANVTHANICPMNKGKQIYHFVTITIGFTSLLEREFHDSQEVGTEVFIDSSPRRGHKTIANCRFSIWKLKRYRFRELSIVELKKTPHSAIIN
jgi:hypothetical protein